MQPRHTSAVILLNGADFPNMAVQGTPKPLIICVDGGTRHAINQGIRPDIILGDFDSLPPDAREKYQGKSIEWISHPPDKDQYETDSELAVRIAKERGATDIRVYGYIGTRFDHMIANLFLLATQAATALITIYTSYQTLTLVTAHWQGEGTKGDTVSLIPVRGDAVGVTTHGLTYALQEATLKQGTTLGISNLMEETTAAVTIRSGCLLIVQTPQENLNI